MTPTASGFDLTHAVSYVRQTLSDAGLPAVVHGLGLAVMIRHAPGVYFASPRASGIDVHYMTGLHTGRRIGTYPTAPRAAGAILDDMEGLTA